MIRPVLLRLVRLFHLRLVGLRLVALRLGLGFHDIRLRRGCDAHLALQAREDVLGV